MILAPGIKLYKHQTQTLRKLRSVKRFYDISDAGTGKTLPNALAWAERRRKGGGALLVLCPRTAMISTWRDQLAQYFGEHAFWIRVAPALKRERAFIPGADIYITNLDAIKWLVKKSITWFQERNIDSFIIDEAEAYKHHTSARSKAALKVFWLPCFEYGSLLTGTPWAVSVMEMWHQMMLIDKGKRLGSNFYALRETIQKPVQTGPKPEHRKWVDREHAEEALVGMLRDVSIRHDLDQCTDIPEQSVHQIYFDLGTKHRHAYDQLRTEAVLRLENEQIVGVHAAALRTKLLQVTSGSVYGELGAIQVDPARYELIIQLIKERKHPSIVFFTWKHQRQQLVALATKEKVSHVYIDGSVSDKNRAEVVRDFQAGAYQAIFLQHDAAARALTLTKARTCIWAGPPNLPSTYKQGNRRSRRIGQKFKTEVLLIIARDTLEERVFEIFEQRRGRLDNMLEMLKA